MAEIAKWHSSQILPIIRHNMRRLDDGNKQGNKSIHPELTCRNYSLVNRGNSCNEINQYRKKITKECYQYKRENLVYAVEIVIQCPSDCPKEQMNDFFQSCFGYVCSTLPMGERCVFVAEIHMDEKHLAPDGAVLSKGHLHIMYVPAVLDTKHEDYMYKLCADALTRREVLKKFHPELQKYLEEHGIAATVYHSKSSGEKSIGLSVSQLKHITEKTGVRIEHTITADRLSQIITENMESRKMLRQQQQKLKRLETEISRTHERGSRNAGWGNGIEWGATAGWGNGRQMRERGGTR